MWSSSVGIFSIVLATTILSIMVVEASYELNGKKIFHFQTPRGSFKNMREIFADMDVWQERAIEGQEDMLEVTVYATPEMIKTMTMSRIGVMAKTKEIDLNMDELILTEQKTMADCRSRSSDFLQVLPSLEASSSSSFFDCFRPAAEIFKFTDALVEKYPSFLTKFPISKTVQGRTIYGYKLAASTATKPAIFVEGMLHAREWLGPPTLIYTMTSLLDGLTIQNDAKAKQMLSDFDFYFVPIVNIDGYMYSWTDNRMWRKNRRNNSRKMMRGWFDTYGVDLNRNFGPAKNHCGPGSSTNSRSDSYCGTAPYSEPEVKGIYDFINLHPEIKGSIDIHTYGDLVLRPYANSNTPIDEPNMGKMEQIGDRMMNEINNYDPNNKGRFTSIRAAKLYVASGTFLDCMYEEFQQMPSITFELRGGNFVVSPSLIRVSGREIFRGMEIFTEELNGY